jgi:hypothetical protein
MRHNAVQSDTLRTKAVAQLVKDYLDFLSKPPKPTAEPPFSMRSEER